MGSRVAEEVEVSIAIITIRDDDENKVDVSMEFEPTVSLKDEDKLTAAHYTALRILDFLQEDVADEPGEVKAS